MLDVVVFFAYCCGYTHCDRFPCVILLDVFDCFLDVVVLFAYCAGILLPTLVVFYADM